MEKAVAFVRFSAQHFLSGFYCRAKRNLYFVLSAALP